MLFCGTGRFHLNRKQSTAVEPALYLIMFLGYDIVDLPPIFGCPTADRCLAFRVIRNKTDFKFAQRLRHLNGIVL